MKSQKAVEDALLRRDPVIGPTNRPQGRHKLLFDLLRDANLVSEALLPRQGRTEPEVQISPDMLAASLRAKP